MRMGAPAHAVKRGLTGRAGSRRDHIGALRSGPDLRRMRAIRRHAREPGARGGLAAGASAAGLRRAAARVARSHAPQRARRTSRSSTVTPSARRSTERSDWLTRCRHPGRARGPTRHGGASSATGTRRSSHRSFRGGRPPPRPMRSTSASSPARRPDFSRRRRRRPRADAAPAERRARRGSPTRRRSGSAHPRGGETSGNAGRGG